MKKINNILIKCFHFANLTLLIFYLFPGSILGYVLYNNSSMQPQITKDFSILDLLVASNHFYAFFILSLIGILAYKNTQKINLLIKYLILLSVILEFFHMFIPNREFELSDLFGNILGVIIVIAVYKIKNKYA